MPSPIYQAVALHEAGQFAEAEKIYRALLEQNPDDFDALHLLGVLASQAGHLADAEAMIRRALRLSPDYALAWSNLGFVFIRQNRHADAIPYFLKSIELQPVHPEAYVNLGTCYRALNRVADALAANETAIRQNPNHAGAHWNLAVALLVTGDYLRGFQEYEWRWKWKEFPSRPWNYRQPLWEGSPLIGQTILLHAEQGLGDTIQFIRYVPIIKSLGARIIVKAEPELHALLATAGGIDRLIGPDEPACDFDVHAPLMSLPRAFGTTVATIPARVPYLSADAQRAEDWHHRLDFGGPVLNVGLCWSGKSSHRNDVNRSLSPTLLDPLFNIPGIRYISLQKAAVAPLSESLRLFDATDDFPDWADTAALISLLDLVITVDTSIAHLAGALGKPTWTLLPFSPDWRWLLGTDRSVWYPTMRLFRQNSPGDWPPVIARIANRLSIFRPH